MIDQIKNNNVVEGSPDIADGKTSRESLKGVKGLLGTKIGMTRIFGKNGEVIPVTLIQAGPCPVVQVKDTSNDGYSALQLAWGACKEKNISRPMLAHFKKANLKPYRHLKEVRIEGELDGVKAGDEIKVDVFSPGEYVDISGFTKGKGFQGVVKRHNFAGGPKTHGQSNRYRSPGAIGAQRPQRVKKGTRMAGHMGYRWKTVQKLEIVNVLPEHNLLAVEGSAPGPNNNLLVIKKTVKKIREKRTKLIPEKAKGKGKAPTTAAIRKKKK